MICKWIASKLNCKWMKISSKDRRNKFQQQLWRKLSIMISKNYCEKKIGKYLWQQKKSNGFFKHNHKIFFSTSTLTFSCQVKLFPYFLSHAEFFQQKYVLQPKVFSWLPKMWKCHFHQSLHDFLVYKTEWIWMIRILEKTPCLPRNMTHYCIIVLFTQHFFWNALELKFYHKDYFQNVKIL